MQNKILIDSSDVLSYLLRLSTQSFQKWEITKWARLTLIFSNSAWVTVSCWSNSATVTLGGVWCACMNICNFTRSIQYYLSSDLFDAGSLRCDWSRTWSACSMRAASWPLAYIFRYMCLFLSSCSLKRVFCSLSSVFTASNSASNSRARASATSMAGRTSQ